MTPDILKRLTTQIWYFLLVPLFFIAFILLYDPFNSRAFFSAGRDLFSFNVTIATCIVLVLMIAMRLGFHFIWRKRELPFQFYLGWCVSEVLIISAFIALYVSLINVPHVPYFTALGDSLHLCFFVLVYPYAIITLSFLYISRQNLSQAAEDDTLIRFTDENARLKLAVAVSSVVYIAAEENYVRIHYVEGDRLKDYVLRQSMKGIDEIATEHGLVRSHRSYYVNPQHIKVLRKDKEGLIVAEFDIPGADSVLVSKRYYDHLSSLL